MIAVVMITNSRILISIERLNERRKRRWKKEETRKDGYCKQWSKEVTANKTLYLGIIVKAEILTRVKNVLFLIQAIGDDCTLLPDSNTFIPN
jgi:hypothetical protein